ncbi:MAG: lactate utilization protein [Bacillota bacterium]|nr:lactate utilization protein [Bacillota bacterium]
MSLDQSYDKFKVKAEALSAEVHRFKNTHESVEFIKNFIKDFTQQQGKEVKTVWASTPALETEMEEVQKIPNIYFGDDIPANAESSLIGVSQLDLAIAETGSLAQDATDVLKRLVSTLSFIHIAVVPTKGLVGSISDTIKHFHKSLPGFVAYISGPSRTADIERVLTIGVHGPERLVIVFVDEVGGVA